MKKTLQLTLIIACCYFSTAFAQTNLNVENWTPNGLGGEDPTGWGTLNGFMAFGFPQTTFRDSIDPGDSLASVKLESKNLPGAKGAGAPSDTIGAMLFLGYYGLTTKKSGVPYTQKPSSIDFIYKSKPMGNDTGMVLVQLTHRDTVLNMTVTDGVGMKFFGSQDTTWTSTSIAITYLTCNTPDTLKIIGSSSAIMLGYAIGAQVPGSLLYLDSFAIVLSPNTAPVAGDDMATTDSVVAVVIDVQANDMDAAGCLTTSIVSVPSNGTATVLNGDSVQYTANAGFTGNDTIWYSVCDNGTPVLCDTASVVIAVNSVIGIENSAVPKQFKLYPNPVQDELNIVTAFTDVTTIEIYDVIGKHIKSSAIKSENTRINTTEFPQGMYLYQIADKKGLVLSNGKFNIVR